MGWGTVELSQASDDQGDFVLHLHLLLLAAGNGFKPLESSLPFIRILFMFNSLPERKKKAPSLVHVLYMITAFPLYSHSQGNYFY